MSHDRTEPAAPARNPIATGDYTPDSGGTQLTGRPVAARPDGLPDVPGYAVTGEIARGGMGRVLAATDLAFGREVAVKVLLPGHGGGEEAERFVRESRITGRLAHPGIPPAYELGVLADGSPFLAMKLVRGRTLAALLADRPDPAADRPRFVGVVEQIAQAVGFAHSQGVIHRDLKPANVMVGAFGEVQVMDWGLAREGEADRPADGPGVRETALEVRAAALTVAGAVMGTPAYMAPEQARGEDVDARADVFALGGVLCEVLTGGRTFTGATTAEVMAKARTGDLSDPFARLDACGTDAELVSLARRCLSPRPAGRPADGTAVAAELAAYRAGVEARLRQAERERAAAEAKAEEEANTRREAEARIEAEKAKTEEQRKRRRVQLALAGVVVLVAVGGGIAAVQVQQQREQDRIAADEQTRQKERETRAAALVDSLAGADPAAVPRIVADLRDLRDLARPKLVELAAQPVTTKAGLHARLALLPDEPGRAAELAAYLPACQPAELLPIRDALAVHAAAVAPPLWAVLANEAADPGKRVRAASALAGLATGDQRWAGLAPVVADAAVKANPVEFVAWSQGLEPVRGALLPALQKRYPASREIIRGGKLDESKLVAEASGFDLTANLLARYTADRPADLAELAMTVDARHHGLFTEAVAKNRAAVVPLLTAELAKSLTPTWADPPLNPGWVAVPEPAQQAVEAGQGLVHDRFALVQVVPLTEFEPLAKSLTPSGYRPVRVRPYATDEGLKVAALWRRDGVAWKMASGLTGVELRAVDDAARQAGFQPADVAGWVDAEAMPRPVEPLVAALGGATGWAAAHAPALRYMAVWQAAPGGKAVNRLYAGVGYSRHLVETDVFKAEKLGPLTVQAVAVPGERARYSGVWGAAADWSLGWGRTAASYRTSNPGKVAADVAVVRDADGDPEYAGVWHGAGSVEVEQPTDLTTVRHLVKAKALAAAGWRPVGLGVAGPNLTASVWHRPAVSDAVLSDAVSRQANAAAVLLALGEAEPVWPLFGYPKDGDPTARSYLVHRAAGVGVDPAALVGRFRAEADVSAKRSLLLALGEFPPAAVPDRAGLTGELLALYQEHPDPGLHGSIDWLLRQKWGKAAELSAIDTELEKAARGIDPGKTDKDWYVNGEGQTYAVIRGPVEFKLGSPASEPERVEVYELPHRKRIGRSFAVATREVTVEEFLRFRPGHSWTKRYSPDGDSPAVGVTWYQATAYCNWLSEKAGIPEEQWCYERNAKKEYDEGMTIRKGHLGLTGYRLPTEVEWEYACRAGAGTARYFGRPDGLLPYYAWGLKNADDRAWPVGRLKPNDLGLFDALGNALEWCEDPALVYATDVVEDRENKQHLEASERSSKLLRSGSFGYSPALLRCAYRNFSRPSNPSNAFGFRPSKTLLD